MDNNIVNKRTIKVMHVKIYNKGSTFIVKKKKKEGEKILF
jgi:hypothetical protein